MTVFTGLVYLDDTKIELNTKQNFVTNFEKHCNGKLIDHTTKGSHILLSFDIHAYEKQLIIDRENEKNKLIIAGDPIIRREKGGITSDLETIQKAVSSDELFNALQEARGVFSGVSINDHDNKFQIFTDKLGVRPVYYYQYKNILIYSSLLSVIETLPFVDLSTNIDHISEYISLSDCLSNRTKYIFVRRLNGGECLSSEQNNVILKSYWDWGKIPVIENVKQEHIEELFYSFEESVKLRLDNNNTTLSFLSGGLDSRVVNSLVDKYVEHVYAFNFSEGSSQDNEFASKFAEVAKLRYIDTVLPELSFPNWAQLVSDAISFNKNEIMGEYNEKLIWSGDGGSVGVGCVYMNDAIHEALNDGNIERAVDIYISNHNISIPNSILKKKYVAQLKNSLKQKIIREFVPNKLDPGKSIYYFLMNNDQKRHLDNHYETICAHKMEFILPFFDSDFLSKIYALPTKDMLYHELYMKWFEYFPENTKNVPWQTYPGHVACPISVDEQYGYQWDSSRKKNRQSKIKHFFEYLNLRKDVYIRKYFNGYKILLAMLLHVFGIKDYTYMLNTLRKISNIKKNADSNSFN